MNQKPRLTEIKFSKIRNDNGALSKALQLYKGYWSRFNVIMDEKAPAYAQFAPLKVGASEKKYIVLKRDTETGGACVRLGCEVSVFENVEQGKWRMILQVFAHEVYVSNQSTDGYRDIYTYSAFDGGDRSDEKTKFFWAGSKYMSQTQLDKKKK